MTTRTKKLFSAITLLLGVGLIYMPCLPDILFPKASSLDNLGVIYTAADTVDKNTETATSIVTTGDDNDDIAITVFSEENITTTSGLVESIDTIIASGTEATDIDVSNKESTHVWIPKSGKKFHSRPDCSGMKNPTSSTYEDALEKGLTQCKKCFK